MGTKEEMKRMRNSFPNLKARFPTRRAKTIEDARFRQEFCRVKGKKHHCLLSCMPVVIMDFSVMLVEGKNQTWEMVRCCKTIMFRVKDVDKC